LKSLKNYFSLPNPMAVFYLKTPNLAIASAGDCGGASDLAGVPPSGLEAFSMGSMAFWPPTDLKCFASSFMKFAPYLFTVANSN
jgi:hypothetical protein